MRTNLDLRDHITFTGNNCKNRNKQLNNGEYGLGQEDGKWFLVVSCSNCGDFSWIPVSNMLAKQLARINR
jgi:hypothetical protein